MGNDIWLMRIIFLTGALFGVLGCGAGKTAETGDVPPKTANLAGTWEGELAVQGVQLPLVFHFEVKDGTVTGTMDSPKQGAYGIALEDVSFKDGSFSASYMQGSARLRGPLEGLPETMEAEWIQGGSRFPLSLHRVGDMARPSRPQEPERPFPYREEEVTFTNQAEGITFGGTLTLPEGSGPFPGVVLVSGSGQQNRNEEIFGHKPFLVLSDYLTRRGWAVLRYDDRGVGASGGADTLEFATSEDFAEDAAAALAFLRGHPEVRKDTAGVIGHSEGGIIGQILAAGDGGPDFLVMMAGPALQGKETLLLQGEAVARASGSDDKTIASSREINLQVYDILLGRRDEGAEKQILSLLRDAGMSDEEAQAQVKALTSPWFKYFLAFDPAEHLPKIEVPVLALFGGKDVQVVAAAEAPRMEELLGESKSTDVTVEILPALNHLFQETGSGAVEEYGAIEQTLSPVFLARLEQWLGEAGPEED